MSEKTTENTVNNDNAATAEKKPEIVVIDSKKNEIEDDNVVKFVKVYQFEGETIGEIDMSGMEKITANDLIKANKVLQASGVVTVMPETNLEYAMIIAASATGRPVEFFKGLAPRDAIKIKNKVTHFFFGEE